ncbi:MAG TPA: DUF883 family protein [Nevskiaceae bacterium]|nr:DUF883 family protein [Nevskiaceae bacterium]
MEENMEATNEAREKIVSDFRALASHAEELMKATSSLSGDTVVAMREKLNESLRSAKQQLWNMEAQGIDQARRAMVSTDRYVHEKPWQAIGAALLVGLFLGASVAGSRR